MGLECPRVVDLKEVVSGERVRVKGKVVFYFGQLNTAVGWRKGETRYAMKSSAWRQQLASTNLVNDTSPNSNQSPSVVELSVICAHFALLNFMLT
jgi:hypothetical protein